MRPPFRDQPSRPFTGLLYTSTFHLTNLQSKFNLPGMDKQAKITPSVKDYIRQVASLGGKARARKYSKAILSKWAKLGGRPPKKGKHHAN